jgi:hypothetical protein
MWSFPSQVGIGVNVEEPVLRGSTSWSRLVYDLACVPNVQEVCRVRSLVARHSKHGWMDVSALFGPTTPWTWSRRWYRCTHLYLIKYRVIISRALIVILPAISVLTHVQTISFFEKDCHRTVAPTLTLSKDGGVWSHASIGDLSGLIFDGERSDHDWCLWKLHVWFLPSLEVVTAICRGLTPLSSRATTLQASTEAKTSTKDCACDSSQHTTTCIPNKHSWSNYMYIRPNKDHQCI